MNFWFDVDVMLYIFLFPIQIHHTEKERRLRPLSPALVAAKMAVDLFKQ